MPVHPDAHLRRAYLIDPQAAGEAETSLRPALHAQPLALAASVLLHAAYPAATRNFDPWLVTGWLDEPLGACRDKSLYLSELRQLCPTNDPDDAARAVRRYVRQQKLRIAWRELMPVGQGGADFEVTARELSHLAAASVEFCLSVAQHVTQARFGPPLTDDGSPSTVCVLGMGKLGGDELNAGSDIDLIILYDTDDGGARSDSDELSLHDFWTRTTRRLVALLDDVTGDGLAWRVDLRLRPEGRNGPIVNSAAAMLRYYETWGRLWERAALMRARPVAGNLALGQQLLDDMQPFIFRKRVDPSIAEQMIRLVERARTETSSDPSRDLKLGDGGIRDIEVFVQALQLIWGGTNPSVRTLGTLEALHKLRAAGFVTYREADQLDLAYILFRRAEHVIQNATGLHTHLLPTSTHELGRLARSLGFSSEQALMARLETSRASVTACLYALLPSELYLSKYIALVGALERQDGARVEQLLSQAIGPLATHELVHDLMQLAQLPDSFLGTVTRERHPRHAEAVLDATLDSADPEQAARYLRVFFTRLAAPSAYVSALAQTPQASARFINALGASAFVGELVSRRPELADQVMLSSGLPAPEKAAADVAAEIAATVVASDDDPDAVAGALRRAKVKVSVEVALADLAEEASLQDTTRVLSSLADACIAHALRACAQGDDSLKGLCVIALGKLGGQELGYGSDLDVFFVFDAAELADGDVITRYGRIAQRTIRLLSAPRAEGPGYELDTRLRPSGAQGVLVSSLRSFARYHGLKPDGQRDESVRVAAASWERQTLVRARACAGDMELAARVVGIAEAAAYEFGPPDPQELHRLRTRLERELGGERGGRYDIKLGQGGLLDIEFATQFLQMRHGSDLRVRATGTVAAIDALEQFGYLESRSANVLRDGYQFLRRVEQRLHVVHATSIHLLERDAPGLGPLARRCGLRGQANTSAPEQLMERYLVVRRVVRRTYCEVLGIEQGEK